MKKIFTITISILILNYEGISQNLTDKDIVGKWHVEKVAVMDEIPPERAEMLKKMISEFEKSSFEFLSNRNFNFDFSMLEMAVKNGHWKYDSVSKSFIIQE